MVHADSKLISENATFKKFRSRFTYAEFEAKFGTRVNTCLADRGIPADALYLFLFPISSSSPEILDPIRHLAIAAGNQERPH
jgi:hypothetical protein